MAKEFSTSERIPIYHTSNFIGRDAGDEYRATRGLTDWVATNFELLNLGEAPYDSRRVDSLTRVRWEHYTMEVLERWMAKHATRQIIRRGMDGRDGPMFMMFPHPDDAAGMNLQGRNNELPCASFSLTENGVIRVYAFRSERISHIEPTDLVATIGIDEQDAYSAGGWISAPSDFLIRLRFLESQIMETEKELEDWFTYLEWYERMLNENAWTGEIVSAELIKENPLTISLNLKSSGRELGLLKWLPQRKGPMSYLIPTSTDSENETALDESIQAFDEKISLGYVTKSKKQAQKGLVTVDVRPEDDVSVENLQQLIGQTLANDASDDYGTLDRERKGLERLRDLEAPSNIHKWIFDISKASPGPLEPPALKHSLVDRLNERQEWAVRSALAAPDVYFIQGPPGTGKTTVIAELVNQITHNGQRVLVASQTNLAVDNALGRLGHKTNVRPIRWLGKHASVDPDPESKPFLEDNVVQSFFLPSIRNECQIAQDKALLLRTSWQAIDEFNTNSLNISAQMESNKSLMAHLNKQRTELLHEQVSDQVKAQSKEEQRNILLHSMSLIERDEWNLVDMSRLNENTAIVEQINQIKHLEENQNIIPTLEECLVVLNNIKTSGEVDPIQAKLRQEMNDAAADLDFDKAKSLKEELQQLELEQSEEKNIGWASTSKEIARLGRKLNHDNLTTLASSLKPPADIEEIIEKLRLEIVDRLSATKAELQALEELKSVTVEQIQLRIDESSSPLLKAESNTYYDEKITAIDEQISILNRKISDLDQAYNDLLSPLPEKIKFSKTDEDEDSDDDSAQKLKPANQIVASGKIWQNENMLEHQNEERWFDLRNDWISDLENTSDSSIEDLKSLYLELVNVHGVTTAQSGSWHWYNKHANEPFDVVIIDEISKATPPEIILASLLGRKVIWVGDHRQLAPEFSDPKKETSEDENTYDDDGKGRFRDMVTTALFERHFIGAHDSLKATLNVQYRMHEQIMRAINPFYGLELDCGLDGDALLANKQHGLSIRKKDSWGLENKGSELIHPRRHIYWVDSSLNRNDMYCAEEQKGTSQINRREIELGEYIFEELNQQVGEWKKNIPEKEWGSHPHLRHIDQNGTLPVAFITFYAAQKKQFDSKVFAGASNTTEKRWEHLNIRVDTVDRFQGAESPIVIVSMVRSAPLSKSQSGNLKRLLKKNKTPSNQWLVNTKANKNQVSIIPPHTGFAKSPNRVNVAFSRAQNLLIVLGNRWAWNGVKVKIKRDNGDIERPRYYQQLMNNTIRGGMLDGRNLL